MQMNWDGFENPEIVEVAGQLHSLRARRRMCLFEIDEELFYQKQIPHRKARTLSKLRVTLLWLVPLTIVVVSVINFLIYLLKISGNAFWIMGSVLFLLFMAPVCLVGWGREIMLLRFFYVGKKTVYYDLEQNKSAYKVAELEREISTLDAQIDPLEIRYVQLCEEQKKEEQCRQEEKEKQSSQEKDADIASGEKHFSLRKNVLDDIQITEISSSYDRDIQRVKDKISEEEKKIRQCEKNIADIDVEFAASKKKTLEGLVIIAVVTLLQYIPEQKMQMLFTIIAIIPTLVLLFFYYKEFREAVFDYYFEHEPRRFKDYAFRNDMTTNGQKISESRKEIRWMQREIQWLEDEKNEVQKNGTDDLD